MSMPLTLPGEKSSINYHRFQPGACPATSGIRFATLRSSAGGGAFSSRAPSHHNPGE